jgi:hypothetical protein
MTGRKQVASSVMEGLHLYLATDVVGQRSSGILPSSASSMNGLRQPRYTDMAAPYEQDQDSIYGHLCHLKQTR